MQGIKLKAGRESCEFSVTGSASTCVYYVLEFKCAVTCGCRMSASVCVLV